MREEKKTEEHPVPRPRYLERIDKSLEAMRDSGPAKRRTCASYVLRTRVTTAAGQDPPHFSLTSYPSDHI